MNKDRCYGCFGASFGDCEECQDDLISRDAVIQALNESDIRGYDYAMLMKRIRDIPRAGRSSK